ncbi:vacuolar sorting protein 3-like isoform X3 [Malus sylvestris]|uniref:vacuolar sorting protein 3-like isoform X3 n=1 Tax=Malus sylvestris TaxID=3752 RepID=UPI0021ACE792|nr:vacuolar sorting protein 3-like isoform X3 [Malus sylvestris]
MAEPEPRGRTVLEPLSLFNLSDHSRARVTSLAISTVSDSQCLIYLGTQFGTLVLFSVNPNDQSPSDPSNNPSIPQNISFLRKVLVGNTSVESIQVFGEIKKLLVLLDGFLFLVDSLLLHPLKRLSFLRGISVITRRLRSSESECSNLSGLSNSSEYTSTSQRLLQKLGSGIRANGLKTKETAQQRLGHHVFSVVIGKRLVLVELVLSNRVGKSDQDIDDGSFVILKEIQCIDEVMTMVWLNGSIIVSTVNGYSLFSCVTGQSCVIFSLPDACSLPRLKLLCKEWNVLLLVDNVGIIANAHGQPVGGSLVFHSDLDSIGEISSYVVIARDGKLELYHKKTGRCIQMITFGGEGVGGPCIVADEEDGSGKLLVVATPTKVPRNRYWGLHPPPARLEDVVDDGLMAIQRAIFLRKAGVETVVDDTFLLNPPSRDKLLESAIKSITRYLEVSCEKELTPSVKEGVDTLLMYLYRALNNVYDMEKLASSMNSCVVEELETLLDDSGHLRTLAFLYASKGISSKALGIWHILARNYSSGLWKDPMLENGSQDGGTSIISGKETAAAEASKLLEESSDPALVLQHLGWVADINQVFAVQVLTSEKRTNQLPPDEVIAAIDPKKVEIFQRYLQWLIEDQEYSDSQFHTLYALSLAKSAIEAFQAEIASQNLDPRRIQETNISDNRISLIFQSPVRERLQIFLESSDLYDPEEVLDLIEGSELWSEKAILYKKLGQEALVLQILALKLENSEAADKYCAEIGRPDVYMQLLDMYLDPQDGKEPMFKAAVRLLHNHGESLDPLQVLERLSPDMPLQLACETILRMLRARLHHHRQGRIVHNLSRAIDTDASLAILEEKSRHVQINDESLCDSCHARLGTKLFAMYPDDTIVCYKCFRRQGESTSVTGRNFKQDVLVKPGWLVTR